MNSTGREKLEPGDGRFGKPVVKTHVLSVEKTPEKAGSECQYRQEIPQTPAEQLADWRAGAFDPDDSQLGNHHSDSLARGCQEIDRIKKVDHYKEPCIFDKAYSIQYHNPWKVVGRNDKYTGAEYDDDEIYQTWQGSRQED